MQQYSMVKTIIRKGTRYNTDIFSESQGSIFQKNAAAFYGMEKPEHGERPFKIQKVVPNQQ